MSIVDTGLPFRLGLTLCRVKSELILFLKPKSYAMPF